MSDSDHGHLLAVAVGNTRTRFGVFHGDDLSDPVSMENSDVGALVKAITKAAEGVHGMSVVIASVNPPVSVKLAAALTAEGEEKVYRIGHDIHIPVEHTLDDVSTVGQDRLLCAFGAYARAKQACVVVDAGTAVTVDFVDGEGVFQGGVIAPGLNMMLAAMHEKTAQLPRLEFKSPPRERGVFGKDTQHAMTLGAVNAIRGLVQLTVEGYAEVFGAWPQVVATGGDASALFGDDAVVSVVETIVPDLQLIGILEVCRAVEDMEAAGME